MLDGECGVWSEEGPRYGRLSDEAFLRAPESGLVV